jgi:hypothetical protein
MSKEATQDLIGKLLDPTAQRDAIHIAVMPAEASDYLRAGDHVGLVDGKATKANQKIGVVDPFLKDVVKPGHRFFIFLYPNTITGLRHVWTHPVVDSKEATDRAASEKWLREFAKEYFSGYDERSEEEAYKELLQSAVEGDFCFNGQHDWLYEEGAQQKLEMWGHLEVVLGRPLSFAHKAGASYRCSC